MLKRIYNQILSDSNSAKSFTGLDALRGWAIFPVVALHALNLNNLKFQHPISTLIESGQLGVQLFYILSAFSLFLSLSERKNEPRWVLKYFLRRIVRIAPLYYVVMLFYIVPNSSAFPAEKVISAFSLLNGFVPSLCTGIANGSWSIAVEFVFYCFLPLLFVYFNDVNKLFFILGISAFVANKMITSGLPNAYYYIAYQFGVFIIGCITYKLWSNPQTKLTPLYFLPLLIYVMLGKTLHQHFVFGAICAFVLISSLRNPTNFLFGPIFQFFGKISFGIYLIHFLVIDQIERINPMYFVFENSLLTVLARFSIILILSSILATLSYIWLEKPVMSRTRSWINRL